MKEITTYHWDGSVCLEYGVDSNGIGCGKYTLFHINGQIATESHMLFGDFHGEYRSFDDGMLRTHTYDVNGKTVHDFLLNPISDEEKMLLVLKYGAPPLPRGEIC